MGIRIIFVILCFLIVITNVSSISWSGGTTIQPVNLSQLGDTNVTFLSDEDIIAYDSSTTLWTKTTIDNLIDWFSGIWTDNNQNDLLISNGTNIGYNYTVFNDTVIQIINDSGLELGGGSGGNSSFNQSTGEELWLDVRGNDTMFDDIVLNDSTAGIRNPSDTVRLYIHKDGYWVNRV
ncbi:MAG: hypothetical protein ACTSQ4_02175 [Candidatus Heimdallarchaeaceae archaeon]